MNSDLDALRQKRLKWVESNRENGFDEGINRLLTELYPDNAHFIYELLQNAEDPGATHVSFTLSETLVEFEHNGNRMFELKDVESITSIGNSTKRDDATSIGKFGVGFKAVFAYTNTPEIHSGDFHFRIRDLVVPETKDVPRLFSAEQKTRFIFPFDHPKKSPATAIDEIQKGLCDLGDNTLLFLSHIRKIEYLLPDGSFGSLERLEHSHERIEIRASHPGGKDSVSYWLRFHKDIEVTDDDGTRKFCRIAIAYFLKEEDNKKKETAWKIVPLDHGQVSIYFPAEKEASNLKFHIHAPFASTVARDSVRDCKANRQLRDGLAALVVESLIKIRDQGLLTVSFLAVLPNSMDNLAGHAPFYEPIRKAIVYAFKTEALTPMKQTVQYAAADGIFKGPAIISDIINDEDLVLLLNDNYEVPMWVANPPQRNQREDRFLESLNIDEWGWEELVNSISFIYDNQERKRIETWLSGKNDTWLMKFYALLGEANDVHNEMTHIGNLRIVRVNKGGGDDHVAPSEAYFPIVEDDTSLPTDVLIVKPSVYEGGRSESQRKYAKSFLSSVGVLPYDLKASIQLRLKFYQKPPKQIDNNYFEDVKLFVSYFKKHPFDYSLFKNSNYLLGMAEGDKLPYWSRPEQLCLDDPYIKTDLASVTGIHKKKPVWIGYQDKLNKEQKKDFIDFLKSIGVMTGLDISPAYLYKNKKWWSDLLIDKHNGKRESRSTCIEEDYSINDIEKYIEKISVSSSRLIWLALLKAEARVAKARYRPNSNCIIREADSQLVYHLKNNAWIPNKIGDFCKPQEMSRDDLRKDFPYDDRNGLLTAIGFGENARKRSEEYQARNHKAVEMGFQSAEQAAKFAELAKLGISPDVLLAQQKRAELPEESVPNPERRRKGILERSENAPSKESVIRERSIQPGLDKTVAEAKAYLRTKYTNANREMVCQCCQREMPFKINDAYYFEAVQCVKNTAKHHLENRLALCPTCAAMYLHARATDDAEIHRLIVELEASDDASSIEIPVTLADQSHQLRFVGTHWFDLKTVLNSG